MEFLDKDLVSIQETRGLIRKAKEAQSKLARMSQQDIDRIVKAISDAAYENSEKLAKMANEETGFGKWEDKVLKKCFCCKNSLWINKGYKNCWNSRGKCWEKSI